MAVNDSNAAKGTVSGPCFVAEDEANTKPKMKEVYGTKISSRVPDCLVPLIILDQKLTSFFAVCAGKESVLAILRPYMKLLEISCHGVPWLAGCLALLFIFQSKTSQQILINTLVALVIDIVIVGITKAATRRGRPPYNHDDMFATISVDSYAFPSGHASRAVMLFLLFTYKCDVSVVTCALLAAWSAFVSISRVLLGRHHIGDVLGGVFLGFLEYRLMEQIWLEPETAQRFMWIFFDSDTTEPF